MAKNKTLPSWMRDEVQIPRTVPRAYGGHKWQNPIAAIRAGAQTRSSLQDRLSRPQFQLPPSDIIREGQSIPIQEFQVPEGRDFHGNIGSSFQVHGVTESSPGPVSAVIRRQSYHKPFGWGGFPPHIGRGERDLRRRANWIDGEWHHTPEWHETEKALAGTRYAEYPLDPVGQMYTASTHVGPHWIHDVYAPIAKRGYMRPDGTLVDTRMELYEGIVPTWNEWEQQAAADYVMHPFEKWAKDFWLNELPDYLPQSNPDFAPLPVIFPDWPEDSYLNLDEYPLTGVFSR